jgi:hypothetical protein
MTVIGSGSTATGQCVGDCDGNLRVSIAELINGVNILLGTNSIEACRAFDEGADGAVAVNELVLGVASLLGAGDVSVEGLCLRPGDATSLVACAAGTSLEIRRCTDVARCLNEEAATAHVNGSSIDGNGMFSVPLQVCAGERAALIIAADVDDTEYRVIDLGLAAGSARAAAQG